MQNKTDFSFDAETSEEKDAQILKYHFVVDKGVPRKLGDGTYGSVFEVRGPGNQKCAVKLFYPVTKDDDVSNQRNKSEMRSGKTVLDKLLESGQEGLKSNLVLSDAWTEKFKSSEAFKSLKDKFHQLGVAVSNYALVMPFYECTLKDVLETGAPAGRLVNGDIVKEMGDPGFEVLSNLTMVDRERQIIGIVSQIVTGLRALHAADLFHHDIKPANVMMKSNGFNVDVALGDFGFLETSPRSSEPGYAAGLPLGTRHYRSPEQKDFFDVCDVKVSVTKNGEQLILETNDRKFRDTLIEQKDIAEFSKDGDKVGYPVLKVKHLSDKTSEITLESQSKKESDDAKTQVMFFKRPSPRTDVFGVGAILFDLLTVGRSPECFYDYLRPFDRASGEHTAVVNRIVERYRAAASANSTSADLAPLFDQIRDDLHGRFPSPEIVAVLFKCMLSRASDSYYSGAREPDGKVDRKKLFSTIQKDLSELRNGDTISVMSGINPIWAGKESDSGMSETTSGFIGELEKARVMPVTKRMVWGAMRLRQLVQMIDRIRNQDTYFVDLSPSNLRFDQNNTEVVAVVESYKSEEDYLRAVRSGSAWRLEAMGDTDDFVPIYRRFDVRSVDVTFEVAENHSVRKATARYTESLPIWRDSCKGDLLRILDSRGRSQIFRIVNINADGVRKGMDIKKIEFPDDNSTESTDSEIDESGGEATALNGLEKKRTRGILIRRLHPMNYYLSILATYVHHLFFADEDGDDGTIPDVVWSALQSKIVAGTGGSPQQAAVVKWPFRKKIKVNSMADIRSLLARVYLNLIFMAEHRDEKHDPDPKRMYTHLLQLMDELDDAIARSYGYDDRNPLRAIRLNEIDDMKLVSDSFKDDPRPFTEHLQDHLNQKNVLLHEIASLFRQP